MSTMPVSPKPVHRPTFAPDPKPPVYPKSKIPGIIKAYLARGGAAMDEAAYQKFKYAMLLNWIDFQQVYEPVYVQGSGASWIDKKELPPNLLCKADGCRFTTKVMDAAIDHMEVHYPEWFQK